MQVSELDILAISDEGTIVRGQGAPALFYIGESLTAQPSHMHLSAYTNCNNSPHKPGVLDFKCGQATRN